MDPTTGIDAGSLTPALVAGVGLVVATIFLFLKRKASIASNTQESPGVDDSSESESPEPAPSEQPMSKPTKEGGDAEFIRDEPEPPEAVSYELPADYKLVSLISEGAIGKVYVARHQRTDGLLAIKVLHNFPRLSETVENKFRAEVKAASRLQHPNLVVVHDYGVTHRDVPYIVMELIDGITLRDELNESKYLDIDRFFHIFYQMCDGLYHAHNKGVVHRDLRPSDVILIDGSSDLIKIIDFGIAKAVEGTRASDSLVIRVDRIGQLQYSSPEQCQGGEVDHRADIYSLGCIMYEAICGEPPIIGKDPFETISRHIDLQPKAPSKVRPDLNIPASVEMVISRAMEKKPAKRFEDMLEMRKALETAHAMLPPSQ